MGWGPYGLEGGCRDIPSGGVLRRLTGGGSLKSEVVVASLDFLGFFEWWDSLWTLDLVCFLRSFLSFFLANFCLAVEIVGFIEVGGMALWELGGAGFSPGPAPLAESRIVFEGGGCSRRDATSAAGAESLRLPTSGSGISGFIFFT